MKGAMNAQPLIKNIPTSADEDTIADMRRLVPAWIVSGVVHVVLLSLFLLVTVQAGGSPVGIELTVLEGKIGDDVKEHNLLNDQIGTGDPDVDFGYDVDRVNPDGVNVPGQVDPSASAGILGGPDTLPRDIPPPAGFDFGSGGSKDNPDRPGTGNRIGTPGGNSLIRLSTPFGINGRSGETRQRLVASEGGNGRSEAAVAAGLKWLSRHQNVDGSWNPATIQADGKCNCGQAGYNDRMYGTSMALLCYLGAGETHRPVGKHGVYSKQVERGLKWLLAQQNGDGVLSGNGYIQGMAALALCEAFGMTADPQLKGPAQRAMNAEVNWQAADGGFRYTPKQLGDLSVHGWHMQALKSGQTSGLNVPNATLAGGVAYVDAVYDANSGGYGYQTPQATQRMTAVGCLLRQYNGWGPRHPGLNKGVELLRRVPPSPAVKDMYYFYYATQVMHHMGGDIWDQWNGGVNGRPGMRDLLVESQDQGQNGDKRDQKGSWDPTGDAFGAQFGRLAYTCMCVLTLEVYYRYLPLYKRELAAAKDEPARDAR
jgi:hypothetical protein